MLEQHKSNICINEDTAVYWH